VDESESGQSLEEVIDDASGSKQERRNSTMAGDNFRRLLGLRGLRHDRNVHHIASFVRVTVQLADGECIAVTCEKVKTVEYLASRIEAEYSYRHNVEKDRLCVVLLCDFGGIALNFRDRVGDILQMDDIVTVLHCQGLHGALPRVQANAQRRFLEPLQPQPGPGHVRRVFAVV
jgi:hypothetical protein